jgi:kynurenine formamidase
MCNEGYRLSGTWKGWIDVPEPTLVGSGQWLDLSHTLSDDVPRVPIVPQPRFSLWRKLPTFPNVTEMQMIVHLGTHVDAPRHFIADGPAFNDIPLSRLYGGGVVWRFDAKPYDVIEPADLQAQQPKLRRGDILMIDTGWSEKAGTEDYERHPSLSVASAEWLVKQGIKMLAVDFGTPEACPDKRWPGWAWPVHHVLLSRGVLVAEHLRNLRPLAGQRVDAMLLGLSIKDADGAPARVVARLAA